jgi:hypothetical protein
LPIFSPVAVVISGETTANALPPSAFRISSTPAVMLPHWSEPPSWSRQPSVR